MRRPSATEGLDGSELLDRLLADAPQHVDVDSGADEPTQAGGSFLAPTDVTGVVSSANWNNEVTNAGVDTAVMEDVNGTVASTSTGTTGLAGSLVLRNSSCFSAPGGASGLTVMATR